MNCEKCPLRLIDESQRYPARLKDSLENLSHVKAFLLSSLEDLSNRETTEAVRRNYKRVSGLLVIIDDTIRKIDAYDKDGRLQIVAIASHLNRLKSANKVLLAEFHHVSARLEVAEDTILKGNSYRDYIVSLPPCF